MRVYAFEFMFGLKLNFMGSGVLLVKGDNDIVSFDADMFGYQVHVKIFRLLVSFSPLKTIDWDT
jgi:hypothetical protein